MFVRFFIDRPIFASVMAIIILLVGVLSLFALPIAQYPQISPPSVSACKRHLHRCGRGHRGAVRGLRPSRSRSTVPRT